MRKFLIAAAAGLMVVVAGSLTAPRAEAMPLALPTGMIYQLNMIEHVELVNQNSGQREWHRLSARCSQRAGHDNHQPGRGGDQEFAHEISLYLTFLHY